MRIPSLIRAGVTVDIKAPKSDSTPSSATGSGSPVNFRI